MRYSAASDSAFSDASSTGLSTFFGPSASLTMRIASTAGFSTSEISRTTAPTCRRAVGPSVGSRYFSGFAKRSARLPAVSMY
ncbi:MAG: hypothetical protein IJ387_12385 [Thermoguttaceae bacterium]|nr:hypothetical protein [Thermoguttaceae bacterium]